MTAAHAWSGDNVRRARAAMRPRLPLPCWWCKRPVLPGSNWVVEHVVPRSLRPDLALDPSNWWVSHRRCSDASGGRMNARRKTTSPRADGVRIERDVRAW